MSSEGFTFEWNQMPFFFPFVILFQQLMMFLKKEKKNQGSPLWMDAWVYWQLDESQN